VLFRSGQEGQTSLHRFLTSAGQKSGFGLSKIRGVESPLSGPSHLPKGNRVGFLRSGGYEPSLSNTNKWKK